MTSLPTRERPCLLRSITRNLSAVSMRVLSISLLTATQSLRPKIGLDSLSDLFSSEPTSHGLVMIVPSSLFDVAVEFWSADVTGKCHLPRRQRELFNALTTTGRRVACTPSLMVLESEAVSLTSSRGGASRVYT